MLGVHNQTYAYEYGCEQVCLCESVCMRVIKNNNILYD